ncbi:MAG: hypothetical protein LC714_06505 [Actinobacteria bacterium]|nr:hypothetical protein [Actinomycetota bacterium]
MSSTGKEDVIHADERPHLIVLRGPSLGNFFALEGETRAALTRAADEALYRAKRSGGNTVSE